MDHSAGDALIRDLCSDPQRFTEEGRAYNLLQAYFAGYSVDTLRALLRSTNRAIQRAAAFVASELGTQACSVSDDVVPLLASGDRYLQYHGLEVLAVCAIGHRVRHYAHVALAMDSEDAVIRALAMRLLSNAERSQLEAARLVLEVDAECKTSHIRGLRVLERGNGVDADDIVAMLWDGEALLRRYGAVAANRLRPEVPAVWAAVIESADPEIGAFVERVGGG